MRIWSVVFLLLFSMQIAAADTCYYGGGKIVCMTRVNDIVSFHGGEPMWLTGDMGIRFRDDTSDRIREAALKRYGLVVVEQYADWPHYVKVSVPKGTDAFRVSRLLVENGIAKWAQPIWIQKGELLSTVPNDTYYTNQSWHHEMIRSPGAWDITTGDPRVIIAIIDCGVDTQHPDLWPNLLTGISFVPTEPYVDPNMNTFATYQMAHGTAVAGLAAAKGNNSIGVAGVCWDCAILPIKYSSAEIGYPTDRKLAAMKWAVDTGAWVINNSWKIGPDTKEDENGNRTCITVPYDNFVTESVAYAAQYGRNGRGTVVIFAAGNEGCNTDLNENFQTDDFVVVSALAANGAIASYSNYGAAIDIGSPAGYDITIDMRALTTTDSTLPGKGYNPHYVGDLPDQNYTRFFNGTSGAAPQVTAAIALMLTVAPYLTVTEAIACLKSSAAVPIQPCKYGDSSLCYGAGVLNVQAMVENAKNGLCGGAPECSDPDDCGSGMKCWNGICVGKGAVDDDDTIPDNTVLDDAVLDDVPIGDNEPSDETLGDDRVISDDVPLSDGATTPDNTLETDEAPIADDVVAESGDEGGCGCALI